MKQNSNLYKSMKKTKLSWKESNKQSLCVFCGKKTKRTKGLNVHVCLECDKKYR